MKLFYLLLPLYIPYIACENGYKFCVSDSDAVSQKCKAVQKGNSQVACVSVIDSADCALKLIDKKVHFGVFSAEDALFVSNQIVNQVNVIGELRNKERINEPFSFETVVVVRSHHNGGFGGLRSTNYCHPGFGDGQFWTDRVLKEFESAVVPRVCKNDLSSVELEISSLAEFFKTACRPGQWSFDDMLDRKLKRKFPTLCSLCDSPHRCAYNEDFQGSHKEALTCLTDNDGDVTYVALEYVKEHFGLKPNTQPKANPDEYKFLCADGSYRPLRDPCTWISQPWPVVVALKENAAALKSSIMNEFLCKRPECREKWQDAFTLLLEGTSQAFLPVSSKDDNLLKFLRETRTIPGEREGGACKNNTAVRLCTINAAEYSKCSWLKQAVISQGIEPRLNCVQSYNLWSCFDLIKKGQADVVGIDSDYTFIAKNTFDLSTVIYQDNNNEFFFLILPIIKADSKIKSLADFKNKRISFPEFDGLAWNSFLSSVKKTSLFPKICPYVNAVAAFLKSACLPGIYDVNHKYFNSTVPENLCSLCSKVNNSSKDECMANSSNKYYGDFGALDLLVQNKTDIAIVDYWNLFSKENESKFKELDRNSYRILCKDGTLKPLIEFLKIGTDCAMSYGLRAELISRSSIKKSDRNNIAELFLKMNDRFGERLSSSDNPIMMYRPFNETAGLVFKEFTVDLVSTHDENNHFISSLVELKTANSEECHEWKLSSAARHSDISKVFLFVSCLYYFFIVQH